MKIGETKFKNTLLVPPNRAANSVYLGNWVASQKKIYVPKTQEEGEKRRKGEKRKKRREGARRKESGRSCKKSGKKKKPKKYKRANKNGVPSAFLVSYTKYEHIKYTSI